MNTPCTILNSVSFERFCDIALYFVKEKSADVLLGSPAYPESSNSYLGIAPVSELTLEAGTPADEIGPAIKSFAFADEGPSIGYVSYECGHALRGIASAKSTEFPALHLKKYAAVLVHDAGRESLQVLSADAESAAEIVKKIHAADAVPDVDLPCFSAESVDMSLNKCQYEEGVRQTLEYIKEGLTYQLNLSTKFNIPVDNFDPVLWFFALSKKYPAPYYALLRCGEKVIISTSPELFLRVEGGKVTSEPIKGTLRFDKFSAELKEILVSSPKEDAELSMIVDLVRNDISADCNYGSVVVEDHKSVFAVDNLLQMYSRVCGRLADDRDCIDLFLNAFPGGSITGCPKKSSMELIELLEPHTRGPYCGSIVLIQGPRDMISSIAIRTAVYDRSKGDLSYWAGSGIVIDSDPQAEYQETLAKAGKILTPEKM
ncbi:anthranilate synthase component I family protein [Maridesulfovibrio hydrothermalis]|uniref:Anthranilate synthase n=1 Tax=Maridesulfovibrio hydrothermalis AM13 = DSM 14728 TaxID=1121451 RepID=L0RB16_9BACT|nr:anthranilate synthase component I family protein [Maridesulfovibrio hydrothermalis]CCO23963.1 Anthranilate synthase [Maridesulfovibrio hydrothermalis AM13 = DSM 14728]